jgi:hypothetical protein
MPAEYTARSAYLMYYGNSRTKEVHDLSSHNPNCRLAAIKVGVKFVPDTLEEARRNGYHDCPRCISRRKYWECSPDGEEV